MRREEQAALVAMDDVTAVKVRVIDGDTIRFGAERIRILTIDALETENPARSATQSADWPRSPLSP